MRSLNEVETERARLLLEFLHLTKDGLVKPYDPTPFLKKLDNMQKGGIDIAGLSVCCPTSAEIRDAKDFKPYIMAALEQFAEVMSLDKEIINRNKDERY